MRKYFLTICFSLFFIGEALGATKEFSSIEEAQANMSVRNQEIIQQALEPDNLPQNEEEMRAFVQERLKVVDISNLAKGERIDKSSSFSKVDEVITQKSFFEKIYEEALERVGVSSGVGIDELSQVQYYSLKENNDDDVADTQIPIINATLPMGNTIKAPAYEHIPIFSSQVEILPNQIIKVYENITLVATGNKVKEPLIRFIKKEAPSRENKVHITLDEVKINGTVVPYEITEQKDHFVLKPLNNFSLHEGVYVFEFRYMLDRYLWDYGDFYEFYWDLTGGNFNLLINRALLAVKLPGREPAVKRYALTGSEGNLKDKNSVVINGNGNTSGFMNMYPLMNGESFYTFITVPKVDFLPTANSRSILWFIEDHGDILLSLLYLFTVATASLLSWNYVQKHLKFKKINISSALLIRVLWKDVIDTKAVGCVLLDLFKKNILDIQQRNEDIILVRKSFHAKNISKFENKLLNTIFTKNDNVSKLKQGENANYIYDLIKKEANLLIKKLGLKLSSMYILCNVAMLALVEIGLSLWSDNPLLRGIFLVSNILWITMFIANWYSFGNAIKKIVLNFVSIVSLILSSICLSAVLSWSAILILSLGIIVALTFVKKVSEPTALLKNAIQAVYKQKDFLLEQKDNICSGKNFILQQANIFALDLDYLFENNPKIKDIYRLTEIQKLLTILYP